MEKCATIAAKGKNENIEHLSFSQIPIARPSCVDVSPPSEERQGHSVCSS